MDKQTLSNYGWLVIVTLILAVMLALATPFGTYVGDAVVSIANGYVQASNNAIDEDNIGKVEDQWDSKFDYSGFKDELVAGATFRNGTFLTWEELESPENGAKYGYDSAAITGISLDYEAFCLNLDIVSITTPDTLEFIGDYAFEDCYNFTSIVIGKNVQYIGEFAFHCTNLTNITYKGTKEQWNNIEFCEGWNASTPATVVHCIDGDVTI